MISQERRTYPRKSKALLCAMVLAALLSLSLLGGCSSVRLLVSAGGMPSLDDAPAASDKGVPSDVNELLHAQGPSWDALCALIGEEDAHKIVDRAEEDPDAYWIASHTDAYAGLRPEIQVKVLRLAANEPLSTTYVRELPYHLSPDQPVDYNAPAVDPGPPSAEVPGTAFPHLYQWDPRWGYTMYDGDSFGVSGCGPTALAIVHQGLTGSGMTPYDMGQIAFSNGSVAELMGTEESYFITAAEQVGLRCEWMEPNPDVIRDVLAGGRPLIAHVGPGTFSQVGHYLVLAGLTGDGMVIVNDPYSAERSSHVWDPGLIAGESVALYAYAAA